jgi:imidazolonepropionase-like amidohydrolase
MESKSRLLKSTGKQLLLSACLLMLARAGQAQTTVIKAGHVVDTQTGKVLDKQIILVKDGRILQLGPNLPYSSTDKVIDLSTSWVLPGLIDCHVHLTSNGPYRKLSFAESYVSESSGFRALEGAFVARQLLEGGFTTVKEIGNDANYASADVIKAIKMGWVQGPTIIYAGKIIAPFGGQTQGFSPEGGHLWDFEYLDADTPDEIKKAVRKNMYYGATTIKLVSGDNGIYNQEDIQAAVNEARKYGAKVTVHVMGGEGARNVILGGAAAIEHGFVLDDELLQLMKKKGTFLVGTDFAFPNLYAYGGDSTQSLGFHNTIVDRLRRAYKIGTKMAFGTDIIINLPGLNRLQTNLLVLDSWKEAAIPPAYILQTMTTNAAELLGLEKSRGRLAPAYWADIIAVKDNPLENIDAVKQVQFVMKEGQVIKNN